MAKRKKRAKSRPRKRAKLRKSSAARGRTRNTSKSVARRGTKRNTRGKPKRAANAASRKRQLRMNSSQGEAETVVIDVIEEPAPGVITVTEIEETQVSPGGWVKTGGSRES